MRNCWSLPFSTSTRTADPYFSNKPIRYNMPGSPDPVLGRDLMTGAVAAGLSVFIGSVFAYAATRWIPLSLFGIGFVPVFIRGIPILAVLEVGVRYVANQYDGRAFYRTGLASSEIDDCNPRLSEHWYQTIMRTYQTISGIEILLCRVAILTCAVEI